MPPVAANTALPVDSQSVTDALGEVEVNISEAGTNTAVPGNADYNALHS
jgi:hypothetical protein